jgi:hypothetical protein
MKTSLFYTTAAILLALAAPALAEQGAVSFIHDGYSNTCVLINGVWYTPKVAQKGGDPHLQLTEQRAWMTLESSKNFNRIIGFDVLGTAQDCKWGPAAEITDINDPPAQGQ